MQQTGFGIEFLLGTRLFAIVNNFGCTLTQERWIFYYGTLYHGRSRSRVAVNRTGLTRRLAGEHPDHKQQHNGKWQKRVQQTCQRHSKTPWEPPYSIAGIALGPYDT